MPADFPDLEEENAGEFEERGGRGDFPRDPKIAAHVQEARNARQGARTIRGPCLLPEGWPSAADDLARRACKRYLREQRGEQEESEEG